MAAIIPGSGRIEKRRAAQPDKRGAPVQQRGVTSVPSAYFMGLHWMHTFISGVIFGVGDDVAYLADRIAAKPKAA